MKFIIIITIITVILTVILKPPALAQTDCGGGTPSRAQGLVTSPSLAGKFGTTGACVIDSKTAFAPFKIPTYLDLKSLYFDQSKLARSGTNQQLFTLEGDQSGGISLTDRDKIYYIKGNLTIDNPSDISGNQTGVIFVDGNLLINPNSKKFTHGNENSGIVFVVKGNVNVAEEVTQIDAVIISEGAICTAFDGTSCPLTNVKTSPLIINGSLVSLNPNKSIRFKRTLTDNSKPAELINHQVKYLVILRNLYSDTLQKWSEVP